MTLDSWLDYITKIHHIEIDLGLDRITRVGEKLGLIKLPFPVITVAGTNGKGSTVALLESIYLQEGKTVCAITSPHLIAFNERLRINGENVCDETLCNTFKKIDGARGETSLTYFEFTHLALLLIIRELKPDVALLEVGLGGRLDATNITDPSCAVITSIALDHTDRLGDTREAIGAEKAGILRDNIPFICGDTDAPQSVIEKAKNHHCRAYFSGVDFSFKEKENEWSWSSSNTAYQHLKKPLLAIQNASTAIMAVTAMQDTIAVSKSSIENGIRTASLPGRFEVSNGDVTTILDVAHNPAASKLLAHNISSLSPKGKVFAVFSILADKDIEKTIEPMLAIVDHWFITEIQDEQRAASIETIEKALKGKAHYTSYQSLTDAQSHAQKMAVLHDTIVTFGSFHMTVI